MSGVCLKPTLAELGSLSFAADKLWQLDSNRLVYGRDYELELQTFRKRDDGDVALKPLFTRVETSVLDRPTFKAFISLLDNYSSLTGEAEVVTSEEINEYPAFLNVRCFLLLLLKYENILARSFNVECCT
jgi:hypothetical protein